MFEPLTEGFEFARFAAGDVENAFEVVSVRVMRHELEDEHNLQREQVTCYCEEC